MYKTIPDEFMRLGPLGRFRYMLRHDPLFGPLLVLGLPSLAWLVWSTWFS